MSRVLGEVGSFRGVGSVVVKLPFSSGVTNYPVMKGSEGHMARFFNGESRSLAGFCWILKPRNQTDTIKIPDGGEVA